VLASQSDVNPGSDQKLKVVNRVSLDHPRTGHSVVFKSPLDRLLSSKTKINQKGRLEGATESTYLDVNNLKVDEGLGPYQ
jgi:hypothetical protein